MIPIFRQDCRSARFPARRPLAVLAAAAFCAAPLAAAPTLPTILPAVFSITAFGAIGDSRTDNTLAIQNAINAAQSAGGGTLEVPAAAGSFLCGPISITGNINLQVDAGAILQALPYGNGTNAPGTYPLAGTAYTNFISISGNNVEISGTGTIDGQGAPWWAAYNANNNIPHRPYLIKVSNANFVWVKNVTLTNSPQEHLAFGASSNVTIDGVTVATSASSPNTDGFDPAGSHYLIQNCTINDGDDDIALKPEDSLCTDITIQNCTIGAGHGISIGGQTNDGLNGMTVTNCTFNGTQYGLRMKADPTEGGPVQNVTYSNLTMTNVQYPIIFYSYYDQVGTPGATSGSNQTTPAKVKSWNATPPSAAYDSYNTATMPIWQNITINNLTSTNPSGAPGYCVIWGLPNQYIANVTLNNVQISGSVGFEFFNAQNVQFTGTTSLSGSLIAYNAQVIPLQPQNQTVASGGTIAFNVASLATAGANGAILPAYQWNFNGQPLTDGAQPDGASVTGSATATLLLRNSPAGAAGGYAATVTEALDSYNGGLLPNAFPAAAAGGTGTLAVSATADTGRLINLSARAVVGTGSSSLTAGFVIGGAGNNGSAKQILVRGLGPALSAFGVPGVLADPDLQVFGLPSGTVVATNDNWGGNATVTEISTQVGAFPLTNPASLDAALVASLIPGEYTANVTGNAAATGVALAEIYDATAVFTPATPRLVNLSARAQTGPGSVIAGFVIGGSTSATVLIRGIGPALGSLGVPGALADPSFQVFTAAGAVAASNDNWGGDLNVAGVSAQVGAFALTNPASLDAALVLSLPPGAYTVNLAGAGNSTGVALLEVYAVP